MGMDYKQFQSVVRSNGGIWTSDDVYFVDAGDLYYAGYLPNYPEQDVRDAIFTYDHLKDEWTYKGPKTVELKRTLDDTIAKASAQEEQQPSGGRQKPQAKMDLEV